MSRNDPLPSATISNDDVGRPLNSRDDVVMTCDVMLPPAMIRDDVARQSATICYDPRDVARRPAPTPYDARRYRAMTWDDPLTLATISRDDLRRLAITWTMSRNDPLLSATTHDDIAR